MLRNIFGNALGILVISATDLQEQFGINPDKRKYYFGTSCKKMFIYPHNVEVDMYMLCM